MRVLAWVASFVAVMAAAGSAHAAHGSDRFHLGLGAGLRIGTSISGGDGLGGLAGTSGGSILIPLDIADALRLEPAVSFYYSSVVLRDGRDWSSTSVHPGLGLLGQLRLSPDSLLTLGVRWGALLVSSTGSLGSLVDPGVPTTRSRAGFLIAPALGGEYFFSEHFSLGAEAQLCFAYQGPETVEPATDQSMLSAYDTAVSVGTNAGILARVFFF